MLFVISATTNNHFSTRHGPNVALSENNTVVRATSYDNAVAYTAQPIPLGRLFQLKCLKPGIIVSSLTASVLLLNTYS